MMTHWPFQLMSTLLEAGGRFLLKPTRTLLTSQVASSYARVLAPALICGLLFSGILAFHSPQALAAPATQPAPQQAYSFYVTSTKTTTAVTHGCNQAQADATHHSNSMVVLDFGGQLNDGSGVDNWDVPIGSYPNELVEDVAGAFARGYSQCATSNFTLTLAVGTNNSVSVNAFLGTTWAHVVAAVNSYVHGFAPRITVMGGNDIEAFGTAHSDPEAAKDWARAYSAASAGLLYTDYGSADGCPPAGSCNQGWTQYDYWFVSWGAGAAVPTPEIYNDTMAWQWEDISLFGVHNEGGAIDFWGPMSTPSFITPGQAWDDLSNALCSHSSTCVNMTYLLDIRPLATGW